MNIIEAMQKAENGKLITNNFMKNYNRFLKYIGGGVFFEYQVNDNKQRYLYEVREFSMGEILSNDWQVVENKYFKE